MSPIEFIVGPHRSVPSWRDGIVGTAGRAFDEVGPVDQHVLDQSRTRNALSSAAGNAVDARTWAIRTQPHPMLITRRSCTRCAEWEGRRLDDAARVHLTAIALGTCVE